MTTTVNQKARRFLMGIDDALFEGGTWPATGPYTVAGAINAGIPARFGTSTLAPQASIAASEPMCWDSSQFGTRIVFAHVQTNTGAGGGIVVISGFDYTAGGTLSTLIQATRSTELAAAQCNGLRVNMETATQGLVWVKANTDWYAYPISIGGTTITIGTPLTFGGISPDNNTVPAYVGSSKYAVYNYTTGLVTVYLNNGTTLATTGHTATVTSWGASGVAYDTGIYRIADGKALILYRHSVNGASAIIMNYSGVANPTFATPKVLNSTSYGSGTTDMSWTCGSYGTTTARRYHGSPGAGMVSDVVAIGNSRYMFTCGGIQFSFDGSDNLTIYGSIQAGTVDTLMSGTANNSPAGISGIVGRMLAAYDGVHANVAWRDNTVPIITLRGVSNNLSNPTLIAFNGDTNPAGGPFAANVSAAKRRLFSLEYNNTSAVTPTYYDFSTKGSTAAATGTALAIAPSGWNPGTFNVHYISTTDVIFVFNNKVLWVNLAGLGAI